MNQMFKGATAFKQPLQFWQLIKTAGVPTFTNMFESSGMIGNTFGLTTPTPLKSQFDQKRPGDPIFNTTIHQLVDDWIADPTAAKWNDQNNTPYFDIIQRWVVNQVTDMTSVFENKTTFNNDISKWDVSNVINMISMKVA